MSRRVTVTECPNCGAPVVAAELTGPVPECHFCHAALPEVEERPPVRIPHPPAHPPPLPLRRGRSGRRVAVLAAAVVVPAAVLVVVLAAVGGSPSGAPALTPG